MPRCQVDAMGRWCILVLCFVEDLFFFESKTFLITCNYFIIIHIDVDGLSCYYNKSYRNKQCLITFSSLVFLTASGGTYHSKITYWRWLSQVLNTEIKGKNLRKVCHVKGLQPKQNLNILRLHLNTYGTQALYGRTLRIYNLYGLLRINTDILITF